MNIQDSPYYILISTEVLPATSEERNNWEITSPDARRVGSTVIDDDTWVSTVFLSIDHNFMDDGPPIVFETMVFGGPLDTRQERYSTYKDAVLGHGRMVKKARKAKGPKRRIGPRKWWHRLFD